MTDEKKIQPVLIVATGSMTKADIGRLRKNGICVVESKNPEAVRFAEPPPLGYSAQEAAAISLFRIVMSIRNGKSWKRHEIASLYADCLLNGTPLEAVPLVDAIETYKKI